MALIRIGIMSLADLVYLTSSGNMDDSVAADHLSVQLQALHIAEIASDICKHSSNTTLATLARTCKAFKDPALQELWRVLPNPIPLVQCFPPHVWTVEGDTLVRSELIKSHCRRSQPL